MSLGRFKNNSGQYFKVFTPYWRKAFEVYQSKKEKLEKLKSINVISHQENLTFNFLPKKKLGNQKFQNILIKKIIQSKLETKIKLIGSTRDIQAAMILGDLIIMPSLTPEPFGRIVLEAQALGKIPIAFDHGGASETIIDGKQDF